MNITRRAVLAGAGAALMQAQLAPDGNEEIATDNPDTVLRLLDGPKGTFDVAVRTKVKADQALIRVFYHETVPGIDKPLLLNDHSIGIVAGWEVWAVADRSFVLPRDQIQFIRVEFLNHVALREFVHI